MKTQFGQTLIEVVIALATAVIIISAIATAIISSLNNTEYTKNQNLATSYAQQGMENVRSLARSNWPSFVATYTGIYYCLPQDSTIPSPMGNKCAANINNTFVREIDIVMGQGQPNAVNCSSLGQVKVTAIVSWSDSKCTNSSDLYCHEVKLDSCLANINGIQNP